MDDELSSIEKTKERKKTWIPGDDCGLNSLLVIARMAKKILLDDKLLDDEMMSALGE